ncbi:hypothetical protein BDA96_06G277000 [Sorghum bicolor]|nr:hypothetical protein BDA96_06G277000 [Sorghum bicolor]
MATPPHRPCHSALDRKASLRTANQTRLAQTPVEFQVPTMCKAVITLSSLVWLRHTLRRWRSRAAVPAGHVAVSVRGGGDGDGAALGPRRFVVRVARLGHPAFRDLLRQAEEEYGFPAGPGPIALPCDEGHFLDVLSRVSSSVASCGLRRCARGESRPLLQGRMAVDHNLVW